MTADSSHPLPVRASEVTVEMDRSQSDSGNPLARAMPGPLVRLVEGSGEELTRETRLLMRSRLRAAALVLSMGFGVFIVWRMVAAVLGVSPAPLDGSFHGELIVFLVLLSCAMPLCRTCEVSSRALRIEELMIFGSPAVFFFVVQFTYMRDCAIQDSILPRPEAPWLMLMFTYAMFIPNTWQRAALAIGSMALSPILMGGVLWMTDQVCANVLHTNWPTMIVVGLTMIVSGIAAVLGVHTINVLRSEVFEARQLGQYKLGRRLGGGGMGEVYLAEHQLMKRPCALKLIRPEKAGDPRTLARFEREVRATARLSHWNNIDIFDYGRAADGTFYYVMEYLPGMSLADLVETHGPLPAGRVIFLLRQTCEALAEAHAMGLIHRDIKPANIFAAERGRMYDVAKLLDFGMVKPIDAPESASLTHDGSITGSPLYMSPEQVTGDHEPDARSDIYSLGVVAYYLLSGRPPFEADQTISILVAHAHKRPVPLSELVPDVPADLEAVVMRCLAKSPADRYPSSPALAEALDNCQAAQDWSHQHAAIWWADVKASPVRQVETSSV